MTYYFSKTLKVPFTQAKERAIAALESEGFGVLTTIDVQATLKKKLDVDFPGYLILGACNPHFAYQALQAEDKIGTMLPCNVILRDSGQGEVEVAAVDPAASMQAIDNDSLSEIAGEVRLALRRVIDAL
ncbi:MAG TPA: DUF302 domain-containing protein [Woeseiaceae bacterium]|nr:DUF302 domain-containing protein [Woeseiaceae bacterium]